MSTPVVAIVGRPNVGKSTLFNRLVGFRKAMVHDRPGVTRDRLYETTDILDREVLLIDTGGLEPEPDTDLLVAMRHQSLVAVEEADVIVFVVDGRAGFTPPDMDVAALLRRSSKPVILAVNKIDGPKHEDEAAEFWSVGIEPLITISAEHGRGIYELRETIQQHLPPLAEGEQPVEPFAEPGSRRRRSRRRAEEEGEAFDPEAYQDGEDGPFDDEDFEEDEGFEAEPGPIRIAVVGRPNIGKSTLVNRLLGEDRHVVHDSPGTTMDPVDSAVTVDGREYVLVDTAGVRRKARIDDALERWVSLRAIRSIERCHVTLLMVDATEGPTDQDAKLASLIQDRGRALVVLVNKWDLTKELEDVDSRSIEEALGMKLPHAGWAPHLFISAKTGKGLHRVLPMVETVYAAFDKRVPTGELNRFLERTVTSHTPPQRHHRPVRLYYMHQNRVRPPTFSFFSNTPEGIGPAYRRYLERRLREEFGFDGTPLRLHFKKRRKIGE